MKKNILIGITVFGGILLLGAVGWLVYFNSQFSTFVDPAFQVKYPSSWKVVKQPQPGVIVAFVSPKETALDVFQENINVTVQDVPPEMATLTTFSNTITKQMTAVFKNNIHILEDKNIDLNGHRAHRFMFDAAKPDALTSIIVWTIKNNQAYIMTFAGKTKKYTEKKQVIEQVFNSFQIK